jgi:hypothetical protein
MENRAYTVYFYIYTGEALQKDGYNAVKTTKNDG